MCQALFSQCFHELCKLSQPTEGIDKYYYHHFMNEEAEIQKRKCNLLRITELVRDRAEIQAQLVGSNLLYVNLFH